MVLQEAVSIDTAASAVAGGSLSTFSSVISHFLVESIK